MSHTYICLCAVYGLPIDTASGEAVYVTYIHMSVLSTDSPLTLLVVRQCMLHTYMSVLSTDSPSTLLVVRQCMLHTYVSVLSTDSPSTRLVVRQCMQRLA